MLCFYHGGDLDGRCSGAIVKYYNPDCTLIPFDHGRNFPYDKIKGQIVYLCDMSLHTIEEMRRIEDESAEFIWLDHHAVIIEESEKHNFNPTGIRRNGTAACELTWEFEAEKHKQPDTPAKAMPQAVKLLGRYDVWDLDFHEDVFPFQVAMKAKGMDPRYQMDLWTKFFDLDGDLLIPSTVNQGKAIHEYMKTENTSFMNRYSINTELDGLKVLAVNRQPVNSAFFESHWDNEKYDLMLGFCRCHNSRDGDLWKISMFTDKPGVNVGQLAKKYGDYYGFGGGGHVQAAGFVVPGGLENLPFEV